MAPTPTLRPPNPWRSTGPPVAATANDGDLPLDVLYEILLRLPPEALCRFRAVCRSWRSLLSHPDFIAAAGNPGLLLAIGVKDYSSTNEVHVVDVESGDAVKDVNLAANDVGFLHPSRVMSDDDRVACVVDEHGRFLLIDLASGAVSLLPNDTHPPLDSSSTSTSGIVGYAASTGEHKVLAMATPISHHHEQETCKIFTLGNGGWRDTGSPPLTVWSSSRGIAVVDGVAYFESLYFPSRDMHGHRIMAFDFNNEAWSSLQGPTNCHDVCLTKLDGHLVAGHADGHASIELWFLVDLGRSLWSKRYTITMPCCQNNYSTQCYDYFEKPLALLDDGRIVVWLRELEGGAVLRIYNPRTKTFSDGTRVPKRSRFIMFTRSLLLPGQQGALDMAAKHLLLRRRQSSYSVADINGPEKHPPLRDPTKKGEQVT